VPIGAWSRGLWLCLGGEFACCPLCAQALSRRCRPPMFYAPTLRTRLPGPESPIPDVRQRVALGEPPPCRSKRRAVEAAFPEVFVRSVWTPQAAHASRLVLEWPQTFARSGGPPCRHREPFAIVCSAIGAGLLSACQGSAKQVHPQFGQAGPPDGRWKSSLTRTENAHGGPWKSR
jgi:hypothetical protein